MPPTQAHHDNQRDRSDFQDRYGYLYVATNLNAEIIQPCEKNNEYHRQQLSVPNFQGRSVRTEGNRQGQEYVIQFGPEVCKILKEASCQYGNRAALGDYRLRPSINKSPQWAIPFVQVDVLATRLGHSRRQFRVAKGAGEGQQPAYNPNDKYH